MSFTIHALLPDLPARMRDGSTDLPVEAITADGGEPLRCCLPKRRDARRGLSAGGYEPPLPDSPYVEKGAVFIHAEPVRRPGQVR